MVSYHLRTVSGIYQVFILYKIVRFYGTRVMYMYINYIRSFWMIKFVSRTNAVIK